MASVAHGARHHRVAAASTAFAAYRWAWAATWLVLSVIPVFFGLLVSSAPAVFCLGAVAATVAAMLGCQQTAWLRTGVITSAVTAGLCWLGTAGLGVLILIAATSPTVVEYVANVARRHWRQWRRRRHPLLQPEDPVPADRLAVLARCLDDERLCAAWSASYIALRRAPTVQEQHALVNLRQAYLDELEARNGPGFRSWLRSGARPVGNPRAFIETHQRSEDE